MDMGPNDYNEFYDYIESSIERDVLCSNGTIDSQVVAYGIKNHLFSEKC